MASLHTLPLKILHRILNHLDDFDLCFTIPHICTSITKSLSKYRRYNVSQENCNIH